MIEIAVLNCRGRDPTAAGNALGGLTSPALGVGHTLERVATMGHDPFPAIHRAGQNSEPIEITQRSKPSKPSSAT
jgi:hypothetical protein